MRAEHKRDSSELGDSDRKHSRKKNRWRLEMRKSCTKIKLKPLGGILISGVEVPTRATHVFEQLIELTSTCLRHQTVSHELAMSRKNRGQDLHSEEHPNPRNAGHRQESARTSISLASFQIEHMGQLENWIRLFKD